MLSLRRIAKPVSHIVSFGFLALTLHVPAQAALIGTETIVNAKQAQDTLHQAREHVRAMLDREDVKQALLEKGVRPDQVQTRVDTLTDTEVQQLAARMDDLPAGGDGLGLVVFIFLVLLLTDILGYTDIFPFVKKPARR